MWSGPKSKHSLIVSFTASFITVDSVKQTFLFGTTIPYFKLLDVLIFSCIIVLIITLTVFIACFRVSSKKAYNLLSGEEKTHKHHNYIDMFALTKKLSTYAKSAIYSINDNKRSHD